MVLAVQRRIPVLDPYNGNEQNELEIEFARLRIVHAQNDLSIARVERMEPISDGLAVGTRAVLIGDYVGRATRR